MINFNTIRILLKLDLNYLIISKNYHPYKIQNFKSYELVEQLLKNLVYQDDDLVVLNKPIGVSFKQNTNSKESSSIEPLQRNLLESLNCSQLFSAKVPEKHASGVAIFCKNGTSLKRVQNCLRSMRGVKESFQIYECVVVGQPSTENGKFEGGITVQKRGEQKGIKLVKECSLKNVRNGEVKPVVLKHWTDSSSDHASRIYISTTTTKWHSVRVYAATEIISPILGDQVFGRFVKNVLGKSILTDVFSSAVGRRQILPKNTLSKLELSSRNDIEIPLHLHLSQIRLKNFFGNNKNLELTAPSPEFFQWTCDVLNLNEESQKMNV